LTSLKHQLHSFCLTYIHERITAAQAAIQTAQLSANEETKSSAGDKYETGRAMAQLEIEKNTSHLVEAIKLKQVLDQISADQKTTTIQVGSLVITNQGNFYIAISAGQFLIDGKTYFAISAASPMGQKLTGLSVETSFTFNKKEFLITQVF